MLSWLDTVGIWQNPLTKKLWSHFYLLPIPSTLRMHKNTSGSCHQLYWTTRFGVKPGPAASAPGSQGHRTGTMDLVWRHLWLWSNLGQRTSISGHTTFPAINPCNLMVILLTLLIEQSHLYVSRIYHIPFTNEMLAPQPFTLNRIPTLPRGSPGSFQALQAESRCG